VKIALSSKEKMKQLVVYSPYGGNKLLPFSLVDTVDKQGSKLK
jgi:hypothetical protein